MNNYLRLSVSACALAFLTMQARASVLTFNSPTNVFAGNQTIARPTLSDPTLPLYGDHINAATVGSIATPNAYSYGTTYGLTPHVGVAYSPGSASAPTSTTNPYPVFWPSNFGNLTNVLYQLDPYTSQPNPNDLKLGITLTADPGFTVSLQSFDLAAWNTFPNNLDLLDIIVDGTHHVIGTNLAIANTSTTHSSFDFTAAPYTGSIVQILLDGSDLTPYAADPNPLGSAYVNFTDIGIDNIAFSQDVQVPEPATIPVLTLGGLLLTLRRKQRTL